MANRNGETDLLQKKVNETYIQQTELTVSETNVYNLIACL